MTSSDGAFKRTFAYGSARMQTHMDVQSTRVHDKVEHVSCRVHTALGQAPR